MEANRLLFLEYLRAKGEQQARARRARDAARPGRARGRARKTRPRRARPRAAPKLAPPAPGAPTPPTCPRCRSSASTSPTPHADEETTTGQPRKKPADPSEFIIAAHVCDFGNVVSGTTRKRVFKVTNTSSTGPLSWVFDKNLLIGSGFSIEPEKVVRLPEGASATFQVNFNAKKSIPLGEKEVMVPVDVKNGPLTVILLRANVTVPEVSVSQDALDFGDVWVGCARVMHLQLQNTSPVVAEWDFKKAMGSSKDEAKFRLEPRGGVLQPGQRCNVAVEFMPLEHRGTRSSCRSR